MSSKVLKSLILASHKKSQIFLLLVCLAVLPREPVKLFWDTLIYTEMKTVSENKDCEQWDEMVYSKEGERKKENKLSM